MHNLAQFQFKNHSVNVITDEDGELWFIAKEIADVLDYSDAYEMTKRLDDDEKSNRQIAGLGSPSGGRGVLVINEAGMYSAVLGSNKPEAKAFKRWVTHEVLPSIRKHGSYSAQPGAHQTTIQVSEYVELLKCSAKLEAMKAENHKADYCAQVALSLLDSGLNHKEIAAIAGITPEAVDYFAKLAEEGRVSEMVGGNLFHVCAQR